MLLGDIGKLRSAIIDVEGSSTSINELVGREPVVSTKAPWKRFYKKSEPMRVEGTGGVLSEAGIEMLDVFRKMVASEVEI